MKWLHLMDQNLTTIALIFFRLITAGMGVLFVFWGYRLFALGKTSPVPGEGSVEGLGFVIRWKGLAGAVFLLLLGTAVVLAAIWKPIRIESAGPRTDWVFAPDPEGGPYPAGIAGWGPDSLIIRPFGPDGPEYLNLRLCIESPGRALEDTIRDRTTVSVGDVCANWPYPEPGDTSTMVEAKPVR